MVLILDELRMRSKAVIFLLLISHFIGAQQVTEIKSLDGEYWWGGVTALGSKMPYIQPMESFDLSSQNNNNQVVPLLLSSKGRYVWSDYPFAFSVTEQGIRIDSKYEQVKVQEVGRSLRDAYLDACRQHFAPSGQLPDTLFFTKPQYNTWIELMYNQNQADVLDYARQISKQDFPGGVVMIDDNWQKYYGNFEFKPDRFPSPKSMVEELHAMGFKVMLWVCPFVSADSPEFRELEKKKYLLRLQNGETAMIHWWNGYSACYDLTNPEARDYFISQLKKMQDVYQIDGFKFDAGDNGFYSHAELKAWKSDAISVDHTRAWAEIGLHFPFNEYRACWQMGGQPLVQRLGDKDYSWDAVRLLIPEMIAAGLNGYAYACPDLIGGGQFASFLGIDPNRFDQELIIRSAQIHAMMPMMQFSVAPWRILSPENLSIVREAARLHVRMASYIIWQARHAAATGEPIVRHLAYEFPDQGFETCKDQFMLGDKYLVAPMVEKGNSRVVRLPKGRWKDDLGKIHKGGKSITIDVPLNRLPYYERLCD